MNTYTTPRSLKPGVNDSFIQYLSKFELNDHNKDLLQAQILLLTQERHSEKKDQSNALKKKKEALLKKLEIVHEKFFMSESADEKVYEKVKAKLEDQIVSVEEKLEAVPKNLSNQENLVDKALAFCQNRSSHWASGDIHQKIKIQKTLFPEGLVINPETRQYRTKKMNSLISAIPNIAQDETDSKNKKATRKSGLSTIVAGTGFKNPNFHHFTNA